MTHENEQRIRVSMPLLMQLAVWLISMVLAYSALSERITRLEERTNTFATDLHEIKSDVKTLLRRPPQ